MKYDVESAKEALIDEFTIASHAREDPLGNAGASRKIQNYLIACVETNDACLWDWFEQNIIHKFGVTGIERTTLEFARDVLVRAKSYS